MTSEPKLDAELAAWLERLAEAEQTPEQIAACERLGRLLGGAK